MNDSVPFPSHNAEHCGVNQIAHSHAQQERVSLDQIRAWRLEVASLRVQLLLVRLRLERDRLSKLVSHV
jgi:hypothetical protein